MALLALTGGGASANPLDELPVDVQVFVERADECLRWRGEDSSDEARRADITKAVRELRCAELKADFIALKADYPDQPDLMKALGEVFSLE
ncbi:hypothetical protein ACFSM5_15495 [Lacibacterium aquatile]|uniref:Uncharacterized protein n=1 Tax=Lacibacterium aquatile TaxID=1168082 RepID=A0ABW5DTP9_9PROT